jgi:DNA-directed RNA polymerase specialized sigma24 family protein
MLEGERHAVNDPRTIRTEWVLTGEGLERLLACLDDDVEVAGEKYEAIRRKLVKFFDWRGAHFPEECADETIDRVIRKLESGETIRDIPTYCAGIARLVFLETLKTPDRRRVSLDDLGPIAAPSLQTQENAQQTCFERCLSELPIESRRLILQYYQDERRRKINNRQALADSLEIPLNALRNRVQRIRDKLEQCVTRCIGPSPRGEK